MSEETESRGRVISTPTILWKIKKASLGTEEETDVYYFFRVLWKLKMRTNAYQVNAVRAQPSNRRVIAIDMTIQKAPVNYPKLSFSVSCGWISEWNGISFLKNTKVSLGDIITRNKKSIEIWRDDVGNFQNKLSESCDTLDFFCSVQLDYVLKDVAESVEDRILAPSLSPACVNALTEDLKKLLDASDTTDVTLKCGDQSIPAHKCILSCRSPVFQAMFQNDFIESRQRVVDIYDVEPSVLQKLIDYVYTGNIDSSVESVESLCNLFKAADKYCIESLKERCVCFIKENLEPRHACDVLLMSHSYEHLDLKTYVVSYLASKKDFLLSEDWRNFASDHLALAQEVFFLFVRKTEVK